MTDDHLRLHLFLIKEDKGKRIEGTRIKGVFSGVSCRIAQK